MYTKRLTTNILLEATTNINNQMYIKEIRYIIEFNDLKFDKLSPKKEFRVDYYFPSYRIRKFLIDGKETWQKITGEKGLVKKQTSIISKQNEQSLMQTCDFKLTMQPKRPKVDNKELFFEKVTFTPGKIKGSSFSFYSTETESSAHTESLNKFRFIDGLKSMKQVKEKSLSDLALKLLKEE